MLYKLSATLTALMDAEKKETPLVRAAPARRRWGPDVPTKTTENRDQQQAQEKTNASAKIISQVTGKKSEDITNIVPRQSSN